jgi:hypothetical protein
MIGLMPFSREARTDKIGGPSYQDPLLRLEIMPWQVGRHATGKSREEGYSWPPLRARVPRTPREAEKGPPPTAKGKTKVAATAQCFVQRDRDTPVGEVHARRRGSRRPPGEAMRALLPHGLLLCAEKQNTALVGTNPRRPPGRKWRSPPVGGCTRRHRADAGALTRTATAREPVAGSSPPARRSWGAQ